MPPAGRSTGKTSDTGVGTQNLLPRSQISQTNPESSCRLHAVCPDQCYGNVAKQVENTDTHTVCTKHMKANLSVNTVLSSPHTPSPGHIWLLSGGNLVSP